MSGSRSKKYSLVSSWKKKSRSVLPSKVSGYLSNVFRQVWNLEPLTFKMIRPSWPRLFSRGGGGIGALATGIHPMAAARANGSHAATPAAMLTQCARPGATESGFALTNPPCAERTSGEKQSAITWRWNFNEGYCSRAVEHCRVSHVIYQDQSIRMERRNYSEPRTEWWCM